MTVKPERLHDVAIKAIKESLQRSGVLSKDPVTSIGQKLVEGLVKGKAHLQEAMIVIPKAFILKTEWISAKVKETHEKIYKGEVASFNQASIKLDSVSREDITALRNLKIDETSNLNGVKLHEFYFGNISDHSSEIRRDSIPYMRLGRDWGTFENWQFDFRATCLAATEGWCVLYFDPFKDRYLHSMIDGNSTNVPLCGIPILVMDMWSHAYFKDYLDDKRSYVNAMMREINWNICEARMVVAERANLKDLYLIRPLVDNTPQKMLDQATNTAPIGKDQIAPAGIEKIPSPGSEMQVNPKQNEPMGGGVR